MRVLQVHNEYVERGGEDTVVAQERALLVQNGHPVHLFKASNTALVSAGPMRLGRAALDAIWSRSAVADFGSAVKAFEPDVIHVHNTFPMLSPAIFWAATRMGVPVVNTLHNYRYICANGLLLRDGAPCEDCVGGLLGMPGIVHRCYRESRLATLAVSGISTVHGLLRTYQTKVSRFLVLSEFARRLFVRHGLPERKIIVKPNFVRDLGIIEDRGERDVDFVFVGRIAFEKGLDLLLEAWRSVQATGGRLAIIGDGPAREDLQRRSQDLAGISWLGRLDHDEVLEHVSRSAFLVVPSRWYEGFPMVVLEALSVGTPCIVPNHAAFPEVITDASTGALFTPNDAAALATSLREALDRLRSGSEWTRMSARARRAYVERFTPEVGYERLMEVYEAVVDRVSRS